LERCGPGRVLGSPKQDMTRLEESLGPWVVRNRWRVLVAVAACIVFCALGLPRLTIDNNTRAFFGPGNPQFQALAAFEKTYSNEQNVVFVVAPKDGNVFTREGLAVVAELTEASWRMPYTHRVFSVANALHLEVQGDDLKELELVPDVNSLQADDLARIRRTALEDTSLVDFVVSHAGHCTAVHVHFQLPNRSRQEITDVARSAQGILREARKAHPAVDLYLTGSVIFDDAFAAAARKDLAKLAPLMLAVLTILVGLALRSAWPTLVIWIVIVASLVTGLGLAGWLGIQINAASVGAPTLILTLSVADSVHLLATMMARMRSGAGRHQSIVEALQANLKPVFLTNVTTMVGFSGVNFSESPPFAQLSNIVNLGVGAAFLYAVVLLPALAAVLPIRVAVGPEPSPIRITRRLTDWVLRRYKPVMAVLIVATILAAVGTTRIELDDNYLTYLSRSDEARKAADFMLQNLSGWDVMEYSLKADRPGGVTDPNYLEAVDRFAQWYRQQPKVRHVVCFADVMKQLNQAMQGGDRQFYQLPTQADLAAQYLLLYEMSLPYGHDLNTQIDVDRSATRVTVLFDSLRSTEIRRMEQESRSWLASHAPASMQTEGIGLSVIWAHITERNVRSMLWGTALSLVLVSACMIVGLRSLRLALVSLIPNLIPPLIAFGIWGLVWREVGLALSVVVAITVGIVVDDTVHYLSKYQDAMREGLDQPSAIRHAFNEVGPAMWIVTIALVAGFLVLTLSQYRISREMGLICAMTFAIGAWMDCLLLPGLLLTLDRRPATLGACPGSDSSRGHGQDNVEEAGLRPVPGGRGDKRSEP
jgi:predicted RND superfamily exporter protein